MIPKLAPKSSVNLAVPAVLSLASLFLIGYGFIGESWWIGLGSVCLSSVLVGALINFGASNSKMDTRAEPKPKEAIRLALSA